MVATSTQPTNGCGAEWAQLNDITSDAFELGNLPTADPFRELMETPGDLEAAVTLIRRMGAAAGVQVEPFDRFRS